MRLSRFAILRIAALLVTLTVVGLTSAHQRVYSRNWNQTLHVTIFPINGDNSVATDRYIRNLDSDDFSIINRWGEREAKRHDLALSKPFSVSLGEMIEQHPPKFPEKASALNTLFWGLRFRYWAWRHTPDEGGLTRVRMFVMYQRGEENKALQHSLGMQKGLMGLVYAFSLDKQTQQNNIVIAHELLHTVGAADKYSDLGAPHFPMGYAYPDRTPRYPQRSAEVMAGRIPKTASESYMADTLRSVIINEYTAREINWIGTPE